MNNKPGEFVYTDENGKEWVSYELFKEMEESLRKLKFKNSEIFACLLNAIGLIEQAIPFVSSHVREYLQMDRRLADLRNYSDIVSHQ